MMLEGEDIICFSSTDWLAENKTSKRCLMEILSHTNRVLYVETVGSRNPGLNRMHMSLIFKRLLRWWRGAMRPSDLKPEQNLWVFSPIVIPYHNIRWVRIVNRWLLSFSIRRIMKKHGFKKPILWFYLPTAGGVIGTLGEKAVIYHCVDEWSTYPGFRGGAYQELEKNLLVKSDLVFASNEELCEMKKKFNPKTYYVPHGVNVEDYAVVNPRDEMLPDDIRNLPKPVIAMIGAVAPWVDWDILYQLADTHPDWSIVLIGPVSYALETSRLRPCKNLHLLGPKPYRELPRYYKAIDVCIISFLLNEHIRFCCPTRFYEHLACGKPIVSTNFPVARKFDDSLVLIAHDANSFNRLVEKALNENSDELISKRKRIASENTWFSRAELMSKYIGDVLQEQSGNLCVE